jgi:hypothetical protein
MKNKGRILVALMMVSFGVMIFGSAALAVTYSSGFQVKNLSATTVANITIHYYKTDGTEDITAVPDTIPANGSKTYFPIHATSGFNGSVVIESDQPLSAIANTLGDGTQYGASTDGFTVGATTINIPLVMKGNGVFNTWFNVQNAGSAAANVNVTYSNGVTEPAAVIPIGAAKTYNQSANASLISPFVGSALVTSDQPVVATVMQVGGTGFKVLMGYNAFSSGSNEIKLPLVMSLNAGYYTGIQVMNTGAAATNVTITYGPNLGGAFNPAPETCTNLAQNTSCTRLQSGGQWTQKYIGSATVANDGSQPLVAIVNQVCLQGQAGCSQASVGTSYEGLNPTSGTTTAIASLVMANNSGYYTGIQVQNVGTNNCDIAVAYGPNTGGAFAPTNDAALAVAAGASKTFIQNGGQWVGNKYVGSATITGTGAGCAISAIVNEIAPGAAGDQFYTYNATNM